VKSQRSDLKDEAVKYKGGSCEICSYKKCNSALEFHHLYSLEKDFNISSRMRTLKSIKKELDKTVLLCSNCHREVHEGWHSFYLEQFDKLEDLGEEE